GHDLRLGSVPRPLGRGCRGSALRPRRPRRRARRRVRAALAQRSLRRRDGCGMGSPVRASARRDRRPWRRLPDRGRARGGGRGLASLTLPVPLERAGWRFGALPAAAPLALAAAASAAVTAAPRPPFARADVIALLAVAVVGVLLGVAAWWAARTVAGDGLFHLARIRKLDEVPTLFSIKVVDEFRNGGPHPGYAFPLWHGVVALVARLSGADPTTVYLPLPALLAPLAPVPASPARAPPLRRR